MFVAMRLTRPEAVVWCSAASSGLTLKCVFEQTQLPNASVCEGYTSVMYAFLRMDAVLAKLGSVST